MILLKTLLKLKKYVNFKNSVYWNYYSCRASSIVWPTLKLQNDDLGGKVIMNHHHLCAENTLTGEIFSFVLTSNIFAHKFGVNMLSLTENSAIKNILNECFPFPVKGIVCVPFLNPKFIQNEFKFLPQDKGELLFSSILSSIFSQGYIIIHNVACDYQLSTLLTTNQQNSLITSFKSEKITKLEDLQTSTHNEWDNHIPISINLNQLDNKKIIIFNIPVAKLAFQYFFQHYHISYKQQKTFTTLMDNSIEMNLALFISILNMKKMNQINYKQMYSNLSQKLKEEGDNNLNEKNAKLIDMAFNSLKDRDKDYF